MDQQKQQQHLLQGIRHKLGDLEHKVQAYRHHLAQEFQSYCSQTLAGVPSSDVAAIDRIIVDSLSTCPLIGSELQASSWTLAAANNGTTTTTTTGSSTANSTAMVGNRDASDTSPKLVDSKFLASPSPPSPNAVFGLAPVAPDSPHDREKEFQGLFTPFFLPLLESSPSHILPPPSLPITNTNTTTVTTTDAASTVSSSSLPSTGPGDAGSGSPSAVDVAAPPAGSQQPPPTRQDANMETSDGSSAAASAAAASSPGRPASVRTSTGGTNSSIHSDMSESKLPRSALRRRNSSPKSSPRRVRFEFGGGEVLPSASPQASDFEPPHPGFAVQGDDELGPLDETIEDKSGPQMDDDTVFDPPPRKISSSDALRALSRTPLDEETVWTVVNPDPVDVAPPSSRVPAGWAAAETLPAAPSPPAAGLTPAPVPIVEGSGIRQLTAPTSSTRSPARPSKPAESDDDDSSDDENFLSMAKPRSFESKSSIGLARAQSNSNSNGTAEAAAAPAATAAATPSSPAVPVNNTNSSSNGTITQDEDKEQLSSEDYDDYDDMFEFETAGGLSAPPKPKARPPPIEEDENEHDDIDSSVEAPPTSPGVPIPARPESTASTSPSTTPTTSKFEARSLGSYKGRPLMMPVVKNPELHAQAASLGEFNTFVGGLDGRSGVDEGDLNSFRASFSSSMRFSGEPRSFTERMMMEDMAEELERNKDKEQGEGQD